MVQSYKGLPVGDPQDLGFSASRLARLSTAMAQSVKKGAVPNAVVIVGRGGKVAFADAHGFNDLDTKSEVGFDSLFKMYSQTKPVTAVVAMALFEEGVIFLDDPIAKYLPEFADRRILTPAPIGGWEVRSSPPVAYHTVPARREITIFDLMTMTSGIGGTLDNPAFEPIRRAIFAGYGMEPDSSGKFHVARPYQDTILHLAQLPLHAQPGEQWKYGSDFDILTLLLQRVTGKPLDQLFDEYVVKRLRMNDTAFYPSAESLSRMVSEYNRAPDGSLVVRETAANSEKASLGQDQRLVSGNGIFGGMLSTPNDFSLFAQMLLNGGVLNGERVLGRKTVELMTMNHIGSRQINLFTGPGHGFGLGYAVRTSVAGTHLPGSIGTFGWGGAAGTAFIIDPVEDMFVLFFTQVMMYQRYPADFLWERVQKLSYEALI